MALSVLVKRPGQSYRLLSMAVRDGSGATWLCGACGAGKLGPFPAVGDACQCGAIVAEVDRADEIRAEIERQKWLQRMEWERQHQWDFLEGTIRRP